MDVVCQRQMPKHDSPTAHRAICTNTGAARHPHAPGKRRMRAYMHVMTDLNQVVELDAIFKHGVLQRTAVYAGVGTDLDIIANTHSAKLLYFYPAALVRGKAKTICPNYNARVNNAAIANTAIVGQRHASRQTATAAYGGISPDHAMFTNTSTGSNNGTWPYAGKGCYRYIRC